MTTLKRTLCIGAGAAALFAGATPALAQSVPPRSEPTAAKDEEIVVTGTYFSGPQAQKSTLDTVTAVEISKSNAASIGELLAQLPATVSNQTTGSSNDSVNNPAVALNLRGLGPRATLVLLNGQRQVPVSEAGGQDSFSVDTNALVPSVLIGRVDVLKDGASALYGSDAVAGVVNFITRKDLRGFVADANLGLYSARSKLNGRIGIGFGAQGERTSILVGAEYGHQDQIFTRDVFDQARITKFGQTSAFADPGTFFVNGVRSADPLCGSSTLGGSPIAGLLVNGACRQDLTLNRGMIAQIDRFVAFANVKHEISDKLTLNVDVGAATVHLFRDNSVGYPANTRTFTVPASNPGNPFGLPAIVNLRIGSAYLGQVAETKTVSDTYRGRVSLDWQISDDWKLTVGAAYGLNQSLSEGTGFFSANRFQQALNCQGGTNGTSCFNPFASSFLATPGSALANSQALLDWMKVTQLSSTKYSLITYDAMVNGTLFELPGGAVKLAVGVQRRQEKTSAVHDDASRNGDLTFGGAVADYTVGRNVNAAFSELLVPVLRSLELSLAGRVENSKPGGTSFNPKAGISWKPLPGLSLNGSIGKSERAPGLLQFIGGSGLVNIARDPVTGNSQNGVALSILPSTGLNPESSVNWNLGVNWAQTTSFGSVRFGVDYWNIDFKNLITGFDSVGLVTNSPRDPAIKRDPATGQIILITIPGFRNANREKLSGVDFDATVKFDIGRGAIWTGLNGTWMTRYNLDFGTGTLDLLGAYNANVSSAPLPTLQARWTIGYNSEKLDLSVTANYKSKLKETQTPLIGITEEKSYTTIDLGGQYRVSQDFAVNFGVTNAFNRLAPAQANSIYTANGLAYPLAGRAFNLGARLAF